MGNTKYYALARASVTHGFDVDEVIESYREARGALAIESEKNPHNNFKLFEVVVLDIQCNFSDFCEEGSGDGNKTVAVSVQAEVAGEWLECLYHVQLTEYSHDKGAGCRILTPESGEDMDFKDLEVLVYNCLDVRELAENYSIAND